MLMPDVNILVYAHREDESGHEAYAGWLKRVVDGAEPFSLSVLVAVGAWRYLTGTIEPVQAAPPPEHLRTTGALTTFVFLTAFSNGCTAMTGVEAVSNGVPAFRPPESRNASATLVAMAAATGTWAPMESPDWTRASLPTNPENGGIPARLRAGRMNSTARRGAEWRRPPRPRNAPVPVRSSIIPPTRNSVVLTMIWWTTKNTAAESDAENAFFTASSDIGVSAGAYGLTHCQALGY